MVSRTAIRNLWHQWNSEKGDGGLPFRYRLEDWTGCSDAAFPSVGKGGPHGRSGSREQIGICPRSPALCVFQARIWVRNGDPITQLPQSPLQRQSRLECRSVTVKLGS